MSEFRNGTRRVSVLTGTRADYGKLKPLLIALEAHPDFELEVLVTGMHLIPEYGDTYKEVEIDGYSQIFLMPNHGVSPRPIDEVIADTIKAVGSRLREIRADLLVVHGDRIEALAGAIAGALNNVRVAHIEGGEVSGTIDESLRHSTTKLAHYHFVANEEARQRVIQLGEPAPQIFVIGSPDIDVMLSDDLPSLPEVRLRYAINFENYSIAMMHPVTTGLAETQRVARDFVDALLSSEKPSVIIHPNNDMGRELIMGEYARLIDESRFRLLPSMRFEHFLTLLKHADFIAGNSSVGVREAAVYGTPAVNIGSRQNGRFAGRADIIHVDEGATEIKNAFDALNGVRHTPQSHFGSGDSTASFMKILADPSFWSAPIQKLFVDRD